MIRVLMVTVTMGEGSGVNSFIMNYFHNLDHEKIHMDILTYKESPSGKSTYEEEIEQAGGKVYLLPSVKQISEHIRAIRKILSNGHYDIVHNNSLIMTIPLMYECKRQNVKVRILHSHATKMGETKTKETRNKILLPILLHLANCHIACSQAAGKAMFGKNDFYVLPNVIEAEKYKYCEERRKVNREKNGIGNKVVILTVGRACKQKNPGFALQVISELCKQIDNVVYWWVGDGPLLDNMKETATQLDIADKCVFWGKRSDMVAIYEMADVFFLPSLFEGLPLTGVEAQAMGLPCVVSDAVTNEMVYTELVEYVSLAADTTVWAEVLNKQIERINKRKSQKCELKNSEFSSENIGSKMISIYSESLAKVR